MQHRPPAYSILALFLGFAVPAAAQVSNATVSGVVVDESQAVLPGVTVTAADHATGRQYVGVTDAAGAYQLVSLPPGLYRVFAELSGFSTTEVPELELLVGQNATINFTLRVAALEESVTVTAETPLVDFTSSEIAGNVDRRQMEELPLQGRNWIELSTLVKGITANNIENTPGVRDDMFQLNLDGQQVTQKNAGSGFGQPKFSREAIAEFQIVTNMFDITQGRSTGMQVNAISRSGTNTLAGSVYGSFRSDRFNAADPVADRVLPYSNQQMGGALGGPIVRDKVHYFFSYEREREPATLFTEPSWLDGVSASFDTKAIQNSYLGRLDWQLSSSNSLNVRASFWNWKNPFDQVAGNDFPARGAIRTRDATNIVGTWTRVWSNNRVGQLQVGYNGFAWSNLPVPALIGTPEYVFSGINPIGPRNNYPQTFWQDTYQFRYDLTWNTGAHDLKIGTEVYRGRDTAHWFLGRAGRMFFTALPSPEEMTRRFPIDQWDNPAAWDVSGLDPLVQRFDINYHPFDWRIDIPRPQLALWFGDTWRARSDLTINYGVRYDLDWGAMAPPGITETSIPINNGKDNGDFGYRSGIRDLNNVAPRVGFTYAVGDGGDLVIRGGTGLFYASHVSNITNNHQLYNQLVAASFVNDGQPGFATDPTRGVTEAEVLAGEVEVPPQQKIILDPEFKIGYTWQSSIGFQKQLGSVTAVEADLTYWDWYNEGRTRDVNLFFDPVTGYNLDPRTAGRPNPDYTQIAWQNSLGSRDELMLSTGLTRRLRDNFQGGATYSLMFFKHDDGSFGFTSGTADNQFNPLDGEWARSAEFQRHTLRVWGLYQLPWGISASGTYLFGSGNYYAATVPGSPFGKPGTNRLNIGPPITIPRDMLDRWEGPAVIGTGEVAPRNALRGTALHKFDVRLQKDIEIGGTRLQLIGEVFNLFNHDNFGAFVTQLTSDRFGQPSAILGNAYVPRSGQLGFRLSF